MVVLIQCGLREAHRKPLSLSKAIYRVCGRRSSDLESQAGHALPVRLYEVLAPPALLSLVPVLEEAIISWYLGFWAGAAWLDALWVEWRDVLVGRVRR